MKKLLLLSFVFITCCQTKKTEYFDKRADLQKALEDFEIMEGYTIELVAADPLISDPVAMEIDENGDWYVAEMPGYPLDLSRSGKIKKLIDTDGDGFPDKSEIYADSLTLPMGLMKWEDGILVADSPDITFLRDQDKDGKAENRSAMLTGFSLSNPQHNMNTPRFGVDNWIYIDHSGAINSFAYEHVFNDKGSEIRFPNNENAPKLGRNADGRNVRFKPNSLELENLSGESQYGHAHDPWGHRFYTDNANHIFHEVLDARYMAANPNLAIAEAMEKIPDHGDACEVFPITENPNHQLLTDVGVVTSSCGITWYDGGAFGSEFENITLIGEPVHNLVHIDRILPDGATFTGKRVLEKKEFLASKDPWFRPVFFYVGPDGALYVIDYYRQIVEHPEWMSEEVNNSGALYEGTDKGRIYRITPKSGLKMNWLNKLNLSSQSSEELTELLKHKNSWYRRTAQRLLYQRNDASVSDKLHDILGGESEEAKIAALWLLNDWKQITEKDLALAMKSMTAGVRENALQITERYLMNNTAIPNEFKQQILQLAKDPDPRVRFQWLCSSAYFDLPEIAELKSELLKNDIDDKWVGIAAIASSAGHEKELFEKAVRDFGKAPSTKKEVFFAHVSAALYKSGDDDLLKRILQHSEENVWWQAAMLKGFAEAQNISRTTLNKENEDQLMNKFLHTKSADLRKSITDVFKEVKASPSTNMLLKRLTESKEPSFRSDAMALLSVFNEPKVNSMILNEIISPSDIKSQEAALKALPEKLDNTFVQKLNAAYSEWPLKAKKLWIAYLTRRPERVTQLIKQVELGNIKRSELEWPQIVSMMNYYDQGIRDYAREVFAINEDRKAVLQNYLPAADMIGDAKNGRVIFSQNCSVCHQLNGENGLAYGPDLATLKSRNKHSIITEIINPNNSIADKYGQWEIETKEGQYFTGIMVSENEETLQLKLPGGENQTISKSNIRSKSSSKVSGMPNGLETSLNPQEMADLLALIKGE